MNNAWNYILAIIAGPVLGIELLVVVCLIRWLQRNPAPSDGGER